jgi:hypothetical protein
MIIYKGPGYVPYNWGKVQRPRCTWADEMTNMVVYQEQSQIARESVRPPRSSFTITARRFVLRADHFCIWARSWIGLKNHRYFLLLTFYAFFYMLSYLGFRAVWVLHIVRLRKWEWIYLIGAVATALITIPGLIGLFHFCRGSRNAIRNATTVEVYKKQIMPELDHGCIANCEEICGPRWLMPCWIFPCCACFSGLEDGFYDHLKQYPKASDATA